MRQSAGLLVYKKIDGAISVFLVHPGGPFWKARDAGAWSIPKGELVEDEDALAAAKREFTEETGQNIEGAFIELKPIKQKAGKLVFAWAVNGDVDVGNIVSNTFELEWPYKSGKWITVPEIDKGAWFSIQEARIKMVPAQILLLDELLQKIANENLIGPGK